MNSFTSSSIVHIISHTDVTIQLECTLFLTLIVTIQPYDEQGNQQNSEQQNAQDDAKRLLIESSFSLHIFLRYYAALALSKERKSKYFRCSDILRN